MNCTLTRAVVVATVVITAVVAALARDCSESKKFELLKPQVLSGSFVDPSGAVLPGIRVQLLSEKKAIRELRTDNLGRYDFGEVAPGKYRLRVEYSDKAFCAPKILCSAGTCSINSTLNPNPKKFVQVE